MFFVDPLTIFPSCSLQTIAQETALLAMPCVTAAPALTPGILAIRGGDDHQGGGIVRRQRTELGMPSSWGEAALSRYGIDQTGLLRHHKKELAARTARAAALWSAIGVCSLIIPVAREVSESLVIGAFFLSTFWTAWTARRLPERRQKTFASFEATEKRTWELRQAIEACQSENRFLDLKEELSQTVRAMEKILAGSPERRFLRSFGLGHIATFYEVVMLALGHPLITYDYPVLAAVADRNKSFLKRLPATMPLNPSGPYRRI